MKKFLFYLLSATFILSCAPKSYKIEGEVQIRELSGKTMFNQGTNQQSVDSTRQALKLRMEVFIFRAIATQQKLLFYVSNYHRVKKYAVPLCWKMVK